MKFYPTVIAILLAEIFVSSRSAYAAEFDLRQLRALGYNEDIAQFFSAGPRFLPGKQWGEISVNGQRAHAMELEFDADGELCLDRVSAAKLNLKQQLFPAQGCASLRNLIPLSTITLLPAQGLVNITLPQDAFAPEGDGFRRGGSGLMMNYDLYHYSAGGGPYSANNFSQLRVEYGANFSNWVLRSNDELAYDNRYGNQSRHNQAWLARDLPGLNAIFQGGELLTQTQRFSGLPINGVQLVSDSALISAASANSSPIIGSANDNATVEVWQNGRMLYRTRVESGPFFLNNVPGLSSSSDAEVVVREENGSEKRTFTRVDAMAASRVSVIPEFALAIGSWRSQPGLDSENAHLPLLSAAWGQGLAGTSRFDSSMLIAEVAQGAALRVSQQPLPPVSLSAEAAYSRTKVTDNSQSFMQQGELYSLATSYQITPRIGVSASGNWQSSGYFSPYSALSSMPLYDNSKQASLGYYLGVQLSDDRLGAANVYYSASQGGGDSHYYGIGWSKNIARASLRLNWQHTQNRYRHNDGKREDRDRWMLTASIPLGKTQRMNFSSSHDSKSGSQFSTSYNQRLSNDFSYTLSRSQTSNYGSSRAYLNGSSDFARYNMSYQQQDDGRKNVTLGSRGALAVADGQLLTHSQSIGDTWGVLQVPELANVRVTGAGNGRTGSNGSVLLPSLSPWNESEIRLETADIPFNVDVASVREKVRPARGSMVKMQIPAKVNRSLLLTVRDQQQNYIPYGSSVLNDRGQLTGIVTEQGGLMLQNVTEKQQLRIKLAEGKSCQLNYALPEQWDSSLEYQQADAVCLQPGES